jgi:hypothetical protein
VNVGSRVAVAVGNTVAVGIGGVIVIVGVTVLAIVGSGVPEGKTTTVGATVGVDAQAVSITSAIEITTRCRIVSLNCILGSPCHYGNKGMAENATARRPRRSAPRNVRTFQLCQPPMPKRAYRAWSACACSQTFINAFRANVSLLYIISPI